MTVLQSVPVAKYSVCLWHLVAACDRVLCRWGEAQPFEGTRAKGLDNLEIGSDGYSFHFISAFNVSSYSCIIPSFETHELTRSVDQYTVTALM